MNVFATDALVDGKSIRVECLEIDGQIYRISSGFPAVVRLEDEWFDDIHDPLAAIAALKMSAARVDILSFWQRLPNSQPALSFYHEWDSIAALPVTTYEDWWSRQIKSSTRAVIRKAQKHGVVVREATFNDEFIQGMTAIFNETPVRQGKRFWHYGKSFETVKRQFSRYLAREFLLGAYCGDELIGFAMVGDAGRYAVLGQIISKIAHRDKSPTNALIAQVVASCATRQLPYLVYAYWGDGSLVDFKRHNGFREYRLPRYYVALTKRGRLALSLRLHRRLSDALPDAVRLPLKRLRNRWLGIAHA